jgi:iron complex outermembrane recepter protein
MRSFTKEKAQKRDVRSLPKLSARAIALSPLYLACAALTPVAAYSQEAPKNEEAKKTVIQEASKNEADKKAAEEANKGVFVEKITVTASRRDVEVNDIPLSISALPQDTLTKRGVRDSGDIAYVAPGLAIIKDNNGIESINVRGVVSLGASATTALYIDETPISQTGNSAFSPRYFDIERVEVLRGPQGTLFGASAMGGAIRVITKRPSLYRFEGAVRAEGSTTRLGKENAVVDAAVSIPLIKDVLALRVTGFHEKQTGWVKSFTPIFSDNPADYVTEDGATGVAYRGFTGTGKRVGDQTVDGGRVALLFQPTDVLKLTATYHSQQRKNDGFSSSDRNVGLGLLGSEFRQARASPESNNLRSEVSNFTGEFDAGFAKLTSSTSYEVSRAADEFDSSGISLGNVVATIGAVPRDANGQAGSTQLGRNKAKSFTQEVRLVSSGDRPLNWIVGGYYNSNKSNRLQSFVVRGLEATIVGSPLDGLAPGDSLGSIVGSSPVRELSVFGEIEYKFSDKFGGTLGLRRYNISSEDQNEFTGLLAGGSGRDALPSKSKESGFTYKAVLNYKPSSDFLLFAGYTTGYRPGGPNSQSILPQDVIPAGFKSDKLAQYELGWKSSWNRKLLINGALFYIDWTGIPTRVIAPSGLNFTINGPQARIYGTELEFVFLPTKGLDLSFGLTALNPKYSRNFVGTAGTPLSISKGQTLPEVPKMSFNAAFNYEWAISGDTKARFGANVAHVSKRTQTVNDVAAPLPGFTNAGLVAGVDFGKFDISLFVRNIFDKRALVSNRRYGNEVVGGISGQTFTQSYVQPRTIGASIQAKF